MPMYRKPEFADDRTWEAYLILHKIAKERKYAKIGLTYAITLLDGVFGFAKRRRTPSTDILRRLSKPPYGWITTDGNAAQILVKPIDEITELYVDNGGEDLGE